MRFFSKKLIHLSFFIFFFSLLSISVFSAENSDENTMQSGLGFYPESINSGENENNVNSGYYIDYYGVISNDLDLNMSTMISDLYYTQLSEIPNFTIFDKRISPKNVEPSYADKIEAGNCIFYAKIIKDKDEETWCLQYTVIDNTSKNEFSQQKIYDSFYKILMESKNELEFSIKDLIAQGKDFYTSGSGRTNSSGGVSHKNHNYHNNNIINSDIARNNSTNKTSPYNEESNNFYKDSNSDSSSPASGEKLYIKSPEMLSGTWKGEEHIDKIVILRGGRGFIIFNNGASMNITVSIEETDQGQIINVRQKGNSNASFYPELPRKLALAAAVSAPPMEWSMVLLDNMVMEGTKTTLIQDNESFKVSEVPVSWRKIN